MNQLMHQNLSRKSFVKGGAAVVGTALAAGLVGCGGSSDGAGSDASSDTSSYTLVEDGKLIGVSDMSYPPLESIPDGGTDPEGFEIDMMAALAEKLGLEMSWLPPTKFDTIIPLIKQGGKADVGVSAFTITDERKQEIDFTDSYLDSNQALVTLATSPNQTEESLDVEGKKVAAQSGTTGEDWIKENLPNATCVPLDDPIQTLTGTQTGLYDAAVLDLPVASYLCTQSYTDLTVAIEIPTGEQYGIVVSKDNAGLTEALNKALADIKSDGTYDELQQKWFGEKISE